MQTSYSNKKKCKFSKEKTNIEFSMILVRDRARESLMLACKLQPEFGVVFPIFQTLSVLRV